MNSESWELGLRVCDFLREHHQEAYLVGGCVRDWLLQKEVQDIDIATSAYPQQVVTWFTEAGYRVFLTGLKHGTVTVIYQQISFEVTTYRIDGTSLDHRHPAEVIFTRSLKEDCARRDFTMNALCYYPQEGLIDFFQGQEDLKNHLIRCIGNPHQRFEEDALRLFRALRFASVYNFTIEPVSAQALCEQWPLLMHIAPERIYQELQKTVCGLGWSSILMQYGELFSQLFVDWQDSLNSPKAKQEVINFAQHCPPLFVLRIIGLFLAEPEKEVWAVHRFHNFSRQLKLPKKMSETISCLIQLQNTSLTCQRIELRQFLSTYLDYFESLVSLQEVIGMISCEQAHEIRKMADLIIQQDCFQLHQLAINGTHCLAFPASQRKVILNACLKAVIEEKVENKEEDLVNLINSLPQNIRYGS